MNPSRLVLQKTGQTLIPLGYLEGVRLLGGGSFSWERALACWLLIGGAMILGWVQQPRFNGKRKGVPSWLVLGLTVLTGAAAWMAGRTESLHWAGLTLVLFYGLLVGRGRGLFPQRSFWRKWGTRLSLSLLGGMLPVLINQVEIRFAEEEFFAALQVLVLSGFTFILIISAGVEKTSESGAFIPGGSFPAALGLETGYSPFGWGGVIPRPPFLSKKFFSQAGAFFPWSIFRATLYLRVGIPQPPILWRSGGISTNHRAGGGQSPEGNPGIRDAGPGHRSAGMASGL